MATHQDIHPYQGDDYTLRLQWAEDLDVSDRTFRAQVRARESSADTLAEFEVEMSSASSGQVDFILAADDVATLPRRAVYDIEQTRAGAITTLFKGNVICDREVTR